MADLPMAQIPQFSLGATPTTANIGQGINEGLNQGYSSYLAQQALAQKQQEIQIAQQQARVDQGKAITQNALQAYDSYGDAAGPESFNEFKKGMNLIQPGSVDPNIQWDPSIGGGMKTSQDAFDAATSGDRPWQEAIGVIAKTMGTLGKQQRAKMEPLLQSALDQFNQQQTTGRQQSSQTQDTQRAYAANAQPLLQKGSMLNTVSSLLAQNTPTADAQAKTYIDGAIANGDLSPSDLKNMETAGNPLSEHLSKFKNWVSGKMFDDSHRSSMQNWISTKRTEINNTLQTTATAFPGAQPAKIPEGRVTVKDKKGNKFTVPESQLQDAISQGYSQ